MIEWENRENGSTKYVTELVGPWDGMSLEVVYTYNESDPSLGKMSLVLRDENDRKKLLALYEGLVEWSDELEDGLSVANLVTFRQEGSQALNYKETDEEPKQIDLVEVHDNFLTDMRRIAAFFLIEKGVGMVWVDGFMRVVDNSKITDEVVNAIGESKMLNFYVDGRAKLMDGMEIEIDLPSDWIKKGMGYVYARVMSENGDEGYLEGMVRKLGSEPLAFNIARWEKVNGQKRISSGTTSLTEEALSVWLNMEKVLLYLTAKYLRHNYENVVIYKGVSNLPERVSIDWEEVEELGDYWLMI